MLVALIAGPQVPFFMAPAGTALARVVPGGVTVLPNGRFLTPHGKRMYVGEDLWRVRLSPDGATLAVVSDNQVALFTDLAADKPTKRTVEIKGVAPALSFASDSSTLYASLGDKGGVAVVDLATLARAKDLPLPTEDGYLNDLTMGPRGLFAVDAVNGKVSLIDPATGKASTVAAGRQPYALRLSSDGKALYVANIGVFDYSPIPLPREGEGSPKGLSKPPFAFPSREAEEGVEMEGRRVPGLGKVGGPDAQSVWRYDAATLAVTHKAASGLLIQSPLPGEGGRAVGASAPNALALHGDRLYVSNANNDTVSVFDANTLKLKATIDLTPIPAMRRLRGVIPSAMAMSPDGKRLYVCESGLNAVAVIDTATNRPVGHIPTGWFPNALALGGDTLYIGTQKGLGRGPRGKLNPRTDERIGLPDMPGMVDAVKIPDVPTLKTYTQETLRNNGLVAVKRPPTNVIPTIPGTKSKEIETVVYIVKENHTFDGIYGDHPGANGQPEYAEFGRRGWIREKGKGTRIDMMPNHHRLAEQFAMSQNFYMEPQASGDGHRWLVGVYPSLWSSRMFYAGWDFKAKGAKGRLVSYGSNGSQIPEDYLENGSIWEHLERGGVTFRNYGEGFEFPGVEEEDTSGKSGAWEVANYPMPRALYKNTCFDFPIFNMSIPDIARVEWFKEDLAKYRKGHNGKIPRFLYIALCNDHGAGPEPKRGYPYVASWMADNDLALGRLVEHLTKQPEWKKMAIFVTQDDSGADDDHVDRHRSLVLAISPFSKRGSLGDQHTSIMSIVRSIYGIFGLGPNNMFDAVATPLDGLFTTKPNYATYTHVPVDPRVFDPKKTVDPNDPRFLKRRKEKSPVRMDDPAFMAWLQQGAKTFSHRDRILNEQANPPLNTVCDGSCALFPRSNFHDPSQASLHPHRTPRRHRDHRDPRRHPLPRLRPGQSRREEHRQPLERQEPWHRHDALHVRRGRQLPLRVQPRLAERLRRVSVVPPALHEEPGDRVRREPHHHWRRHLHRPQGTHGRLRAELRRLALPGRHGDVRRGVDHFPDLPRRRQPDVRQRSHVARQDDDRLPKPGADGDVRHHLRLADVHQRLLLPDRGRAEQGAPQRAAGGSSRSSTATRSRWHTGRTRSRAPISRCPRAWSTPTTTARTTRWSSASRATPARAPSTA